MLDENDSATQTDDQPQVETPAEPPAESPAQSPSGTPDPAAPAKKTAKKATKRPAKKATAKKTAKKSADPALESAAEPASEEATPPAEAVDEADAPAKKTAKKTAAKRTAKKTTAKKSTKKAADPPAADASDAVSVSDSGSDPGPASEPGADAAAPPSLLFKAPEPTTVPARKRSEQQDQPDVDPGAKDAIQADDAGASGGSQDDGDDNVDGDDGDDSDDGDQQGARRRRRRGGRRRRRGGGGDNADNASGDSDGDPESAKSSDQSGNQSGNQSANQSANQSGNRSGNKSGNAKNKSGNKSGTGAQGGGGKDNNNNNKDDDAGDGESNTTRRRRRRRRAGEEGDGGPDDPENTVTRVRKPRSAEDEITSLQGSTRLEAKKQRRREGREAGRRRAPIVSEAEFLARREAVDRVMVIRQRPNLTQIAVLEDKVLVEHYVARESQSSLIGNVYLGRVQNVLPSMEAAFIDIGKGRNAVLYAGEVNWDALGAGNGPRKIEQVLKSGQPILVQVTKDPIGHKGARLTSQISLPGRFLVYVPDGTTSGISRKLPDTERTRLKTVLKEIVPDSAGVIVRTAAEGASEDELTRDVERLTARWSDIEAKVEKSNDKGGGAPQLLYGEPDLTLKVVRDLFTEDFGRLVVSGDEAWDMVDGYVKHVAPDLEERLERYDEDDKGEDVFAAYRIDEQIAKGLDRKVWLPSGGSLIFDRTEAMTVVDVNTGKFTGSGGNLEETVTKNNLEAAEEIVRQLRLRDIGGIIVVDFIDMVLESNRDLVLRRLVECLGRDRTRHQVAEVTSLGLVQMTRKRIGTGLLEAFSESCEHCQGRGVLVHHEPVEPKRKHDEEPRRGRRGKRGGSSGSDGNGNAPKSPPSPKDLAAMARHEPKPAADDATDSDTETDTASETESDSATAPESTDTPSETAAQESTADTTSQETRTTPDDGAAEPEADVSAQAESSDEPTEQLAERPPPPTGPRLVTSSRRMARRPAGPPAGTTAAPEQSSEQSSDPQPADSQDTDPQDTEPPSEPAPTQADPVADPMVDAVAEAALGETAGDGVAPAGDVGSTQSDGEFPGSQDGSGEASDEALDDASAASGEGNGSRFHVPIKKKGSRRR